ncbi:kinase-like domain-containing protein [Mycena latifolia]|nr:kinase-like domain-containing protein [Mycena latifolia]
MALKLPAPGTALEYAPWTNLVEEEYMWAHYQPFLEEQGYMLRPRYRPGWVPSLLTPGTFPWECEDSHPSRFDVLDATRISDKVQVVLKIVETESTEAAICAFLTNEPGAMKHALPILEVFPLAELPEFSVMVMPCMRQCNHIPCFGTVREFTEFLQQVLEGLVFLHGKNIAHRDICAENIVVDPSRMIPGGSHFKHSFTANGVDYLQPYTGDDSAPFLMKSRTEAGPMQYYYIDFGLSVRFPSFEERGLVTGDFGRCRKHIPEISETVPYDPFPVDIRSVGEMVRRQFLWNYKGLDFIIPFVRMLRRRNPARRPDAVQALAWFKRLVSRMKEKELAGPVSLCIDWKERQVALFLKGLTLPSLIN